MTPDRIRNAVLRALAQEDAETFNQLVKEVEPVALQKGVELAGTDNPRTVYFMESGVVSMVGETRAGASVEVAIVGREGVVGIAEIMGTARTSHKLIVQLPGLAYRVRADLVREHLYTCRALHEPLLDFTQAVIAQLTQSVVCGRFHSSVERLARWLLLTAERAETTSLPLTHEALAQMVGAPRSAVTIAAASLREAGLIEYGRGLIEIRQVARLKREACECYAVLSLQKPETTSRGVRSH